MAHETLRCLGSTRMSHRCFIAACLSGCGLEGTSLKSATFKLKKLLNEAVCTASLYNTNFSWVWSGSTLPNLLEPLSSRGNKDHSTISHEFGVVQHQYGHKSLRMESASPKRRSASFLMPFLRRERFSNTSALQHWIAGVRLCLRGIPSFKSSQTASFNSSFGFCSLNTSPRSTFSKWHWMCWEVVSLWIFKSDYRFVRCWVTYYCCWDWDHQQWASEKQKHPHNKLRGWNKKETSEPLHTCASLSVSPSLAFTYVSFSHWSLHTSPFSHFSTYIKYNTCTPYSEHKTFVHTCMHRPHLLT